MTDISAAPFATDGAEKMVYDVRMGPQAVKHGNKIYCVYHANADGAPAHPYIVVYDIARSSWSDPVQIGHVDHYDHHFAPVLWFDHNEHLHVLYGCHGGSGIHKVSQGPKSITDWDVAPDIAPSISYPHILPMADGRIVLYYRVFGHMGYWTYAISEDGGFSWEHAGSLVDFDRDPANNQDTWTGSYHSVVASRDQRSLHVGFVYLDERKGLNPKYNRSFRTKRTLNRYHLYYARLDLETGTLRSIDNEDLSIPVNRQEAERCKIWDTGWRLTNMPSILVDDSDCPSFLLPVSGDSPWSCTFYYVKRVGNEWKKIPVVDTNITWSACLLGRGDGEAIDAYVVSGDVYGETLPYGGGRIECMRSQDAGETWHTRGQLSPEPGMLCNNPRWVESSDGRPVADMLSLFGWDGPGGIYGTRFRAESHHRGKAYLWHQDEWL